MQVGCSNHTAAILDRDGAIVCQADALTAVQWGRVLNETATARATIQPRGDCCQCMGQVRTWRHRLVIWRAGLPVFDGPVVVAEWSPDGVDVVAYDVSAWLDRRLPHSDMDFTSTDLTTIAETVIADALLPDDPGVVVEVVSPSLIFGDRSYRIDVDRCLDHLRDLSNTGMDWTVAGGRILLFGASFSDSIGSLSDADFPQGLRVIEDGASLVSRWVLWGAIDPARDSEGRFVSGASIGSGIKSVAGGIHDYYGLLESVHDSLAVQNLGAASVQDQTSADAATASLLASSLPAPVFIDTGAGPLSPSAPVDIADLIPGYCLQVASVATCRPVTAVQKIYELLVADGPSGESAQVICAPLSEVDR